MNIILWRDSVSEWRELLCSSPRPSQCLELLRSAGKLSLHPEITALIGCPQDPVWHPEGDAWNHTLACVDIFASGRMEEAQEDFIVGLAVLCHDFGKPSTTRTLNNRIISRGHEAAGEVPARAFLVRIGITPEIINEIIPLILCHMRPEQLYKAKSGDAAVTRLAKAVGGRIDRLVRVCRADKSGRGQPGEIVYPAGDWLLEAYARLKT